MPYEDYPQLSAAIMYLTYDSAQKRFTYFANGATISLLKLTADVSAGINLSGNATNSNGTNKTASITAGTNLLPTQFYDVPNTVSTTIITTATGTAAAAAQNSNGYLWRPDLAELTSLPVGYVAASGLAIMPSKRIGPYKLFFMNTGSQIYTSRLVGAPNQVGTINISPGSSSLSVTWSAPSTNIAPITGYVVRIVNGAGTVVSSATKVGSTMTSHTFNSLTNGTTYSVYVVACSDLGYSIDSVVRTAAPTPTAPSSPSALSAVGYNGNVAISWSTPASDGGSSVTGYRVSVNPGNRIVEISSNTFSTTVNELTNGTVYTIAINAINTIGMSSAASTTATPQATLPGYPTIIKTLTGDSTSNVQWTHGNDGGSPLIGYRIWVVDTDISANLAGTATSHLLTGLPNEQPFTIRLQPSNSVGPGPILQYDVAAPIPVATRNNVFSTAATALTSGGTISSFRSTINAQRESVIPYVANLPNYNATALYTEMINLSLANKNVKFVIAANNETVVVDTTNMTSPSTILHIPGEAGESVTLSINNTNYPISFNVFGKAVYNNTVYGVGSKLTLDRKYTVVGRGSVAFVGGTVPDAPVDISANAGNEQVTVSWAEPINDGSSAIMGYRVTNVTTELIYDVSADVTSQLFTNLSNGTEYTFTVSALNELGYSDEVATITATPVAPVTSPTVPCFFGNARVLTPSGYKRMDSLKAGDKVVTPAGSEVAIERMKVIQCAAGPNTNPYVIPAGTFGATHRLLISPDHKVCLADGRRVEAKKLGLAQEAREGELTYYNLELAGQADMVVGGVAVESLAHVRRVVVTMEQFASLMTKKYGGKLNSSLLANIQRTCRIMPDGRVEVPVIPKRR
jgi:hypothetical protein